MVARTGKARSVEEPRFLPGLLPAGFEAPGIRAGGERCFGHRGGYALRLRPQSAQSPVRSSKATAVAAIEGTAHTLS